MPEYEVVPVLHTLHKRSADEVQIVKMNAFDRDINLYLRPTEGIYVGENTPVFTVVPRSWHPDGLKYYQVRDVSNGSSFYDIKHYSSFTMIFFH